MRDFYLIVFLLINLNTIAQVDYHAITRQDLNTTQFDVNSEKVFVYLKPTARIYFKRLDIINYLDKYYQGEFIKKDFRGVFVDTLKSTQQKIEILDLNFSFVAKKRERLIKRYKILLKSQKINEEFEQIGFDLILQGKFMIYSLSEKKFITTGLKAFKIQGPYGTEYLDLYLPNNTIFYSKITALGE